MFGRERSILVSVGRMNSKRTTIIQSYYPLSYLTSSDLFTPSISSTPSVLAIIVPLHISLASEPDSNRNSLQCMPWPLDLPVDHPAALATVTWNYDW